MFYPISINISKPDYFEYITRFAPKMIDKFFEKIDDEDCVNGYLIKLPNSNPCFYDELWLLDTNDKTGLSSVLIQNISGSSAHSLWCCNFDDCCDEEDEENGLDLEHLITMVGNGWKKGLLKIMETEYKEKKEELNEPKCTYIVSIATLLCVAVCSEFIMCDV
jgi:hypothetical protein